MGTKKKNPSISLPYSPSSSEDDKDDENDELDSDTGVKNNVESSYEEESLENADEKEVYTTLVYRPDTSLAINLTLIPIIKW